MAQGSGRDEKHGLRGPSRGLAGVREGSSRGPAGGQVKVKQRSGRRLSGVKQRWMKPNRGLEGVWEGLKGRGQAEVNQEINRGPAGT